MSTWRTAAADPDRWVEVRRRLNAHRHDLSAIASTYYGGTTRAASTELLSRPDWLPAEPVELSDVALGWYAESPPPTFDGTGPLTAHLRAGRTSSAPYATYAETLGALARPAVFENRPAYRLLDVSAGGGKPTLRFCLGAYFDGVNVGEAAAHELAAAWDPSVHAEVPLDHLPLRSAIGDPLDLARRSALPAVSTLTIRHDRASGDATFILHWRDAAKVAHAGGLHQVMPVGVFQPVNDCPESTPHDFDLWRGMVREYSEEFLGQSEAYGDDAPFDYDSWPFYKAMTNARESGQVRVHWLGIGVDPLTWATDLLTVAVIDSASFDELFVDLVSSNSEGTVVDGDGVVGLPFDRATLTPLLDGTKPIQAAGAAVLALAWHFRDALLAR